jgi:hypothetical protein
MSRKKKPQLGAMVLCHHRPWLLPLIQKQIFSTWPDARIHYALNRPNAAVVAAVNKLAADTRVRAFDVDQGLRTEGDWMVLRSLQLVEMQLENPRFICIWDDDHILEDPDEAARKLSRRDYDLVYATKAFFWDSLDNISTAFPAHRSVFFFRNLPGDEFPLDRMIHAPTCVHESKRVVDLKGKLLDVGYLLRENRQYVWEQYKRTGKIDAATLPLVREPTLTPWPAGGKWHTLLKERFAKII